MSIEMFRTYIKVLKAIEKSQSKGKVMDLGIELDGLRDEILDFLSEDTIRLMELNKKSSKELAKLLIEKNEVKK